VKRILQEAKELAGDPSSDYSAAPLEDDIFEWHCTLRGPSGTEFEGGVYHFRILLPAEYPFRPPAIMMLTPNGRFELNTKICISFTNYHEELWQPAWGVRTAIIGLQGFFPLRGQAAVGVGSIEYPASERKRLAALSRDWMCPHCQQTNLALLPDPPLTTDQEQGDTALERAVTSTTEFSALSTEAIANSTNSSPSEAEARGKQTLPSARTDGLSELPTQPDNLSRTIPISAHLNADHNTSSTPTNSENATRVGTPLVTQESRRSTRSRNLSRTQKPPVLLDTAICILLVLLFAIICRRMV